VTQGYIKRVNAAALNQLAASAAASPRRRKNLNLHESPDDAIQRFLNDFEPGTYVRPHRHSGKWELFVLVQGRAAALTFDDGGRVVDRVELNGGDGARVVEIPESTWHSVVSLAPSTVLFEVKRGPFDPTVPAAYAPWAPAEDDPRAEAFERQLRDAEPGAQPG
jgi:cupin fold WbuC family metalloprotein